MKNEVEGEEEEEKGDEPPSHMLVGFVDIH